MTKTIAMKLREDIKDLTQRLDRNRELTKEAQLETEKMKGTLETERQSRSMVIQNLQVEINWLREILGMMAVPQGKMEELKRIQLQEEERQHLQEMESMHRNNRRNF